MDLGLWLELVGGWVGVHQWKMEVILESAGGTSVWLRR